MVAALPRTRAHRRGDNAPPRRGDGARSARPIAVADTGVVRAVPPVRHLQRARDVADARYFEPLRVVDLARAAGLSRAHFSGEFRRAFGESPHAYLLTRRLERAAALLRTTDRSVVEICVSVGLRSVGSFTTSFTRAYGMPPLLTASASRRRPRTPSSRPASSAPTGARNTGRFEKTARRRRLRIGSINSVDREPMMRIA